MTGAKSLGGLLRLAGERQRAEAVALHELGLSPLARGTAVVSNFQIQTARFIPARAGNGGRTITDYDPYAVYPRSRGEQVALALLFRRAGGLSPLARGTVPAFFDSRANERFIPARAGNSKIAGIGTRRSTVYPRSRGEQLILATHSMP